MLSTVVTAGFFVCHKSGWTEGENGGKSAGGGICRATPGDTLTDGIDLGASFGGGPLVPVGELAQNLEITGLFGMELARHLRPRDTPQEQSSQGVHVAEYQRQAMSLAGVVTARRIADQDGVTVRRDGGDLGCVGEECGGPGDAIPGVRGGFRHCFPESFDQGTGGIWRTLDRYRTFRTADKVDPGDVARGRRGEGKAVLKIRLVNAVGCQAEAVDQDAAEHVVRRIGQDRATQPAAGGAVLAIGANEQAGGDVDLTNSRFDRNPQPVARAPDGCCRGTVNRGACTVGGSNQGVLQRDMIDAEAVRREREVVCPSVWRLGLAILIPLPESVFLATRLSHDQVVKSDFPQVGHAPGMYRFAPDPVPEPFGTLDQVDIQPGGRENDREAAAGNPATDDRDIWRDERPAQFISPIM